MQLTPTGQEFSLLAEKHNLIPVFTELSVDMETPVSLYYKIVGEAPGFMLESAETGKSIGRYSFIGFDPFLTAKAYRSGLELDGPSGTESIKSAPLSALQSVLDRFSPADLPGLPPFCGGAVGNLNFESISTWERIRGMEPPEDTLLGEFMFCRLIIAMDHLTHSAKLIYLAQIPPAELPGDFPAESANKDAVSALYEQAAEKIKQVLLALNGRLDFPSGGPAPKPSAELPSCCCDEVRRRFMADVIKAKEYIVAGEIFQVVLSHPFRRPLAEKPFSLYRRLRRINPSPYMFYMDFGQRQLVGASPEMLVKLKDGEVFTCPIAGTRPRGRDQAEDSRLAADLLADEKECAEHAMLVDLGRNDIGRISRPGTVKVTRMMEVENFSHVMHIVSEVSGSLDRRHKPTDVLAACFPAGTVSGAPKIRAMEIISEIETDRRGPYAGAVGYFDFRGNLDTCITIRTFSIEAGQVTIRTGAGIVADSAPAAEYEEIRHKAKVLFQVLGGDES